MIHVRLYFVAPQNSRAFIAAFHDGGLWRGSVRHTCPELIGIDLLCSRTVPALFISTEFWISEYAYGAAWNLSVMSSLANFLKSLGVVCVDLGAFSFPLRDDVKVAGYRPA
jgi:hypothetical protein